MVLKGEEILLKKLLLGFVLDLDSDYPRHQIMVVKMAVMWELTVMKSEVGQKQLKEKSNKSCHCFVM